MRDSKRRMSEPYRDPEWERRGRDPRLDVEPVVLTRKYAEAIDGVDLGGREVGDRLPVSRHDAHLLIAEGWARPVPDEERRPAAEEGRVRSDRSRRDRTA